MLGAPNPIAAPIMANVRWDLALTEPATKESPAMTSPIIETKGKIVPISFDWTAARLDSTEQNPKSGNRTQRIKVRIWMNVWTLTKPPFCN